MPTSFGITDNPTNVPDIQAVIVPFHGKKLEVFGIPNWLSAYGRYLVELGKQIERNHLANNEIMNKEPILVKAAPGWPTTVDLLFIDDDLLKPTGDIVFLPLNYAKRHAYTSIAIQLFRSGKEPYPRAEHQEKNALAMLEICNYFPDVEITIVLNTLESYAIQVFQTQHVHFLGYWHEDTKSFQPT